MQFAEVAVDFPDVRTRTFTYSVPDDATISQKISVGDLVWVPFGVRTVQGVVFKLCKIPETEIDSIRPIAARVYGGPFITKHLVQVAHWVSAYYRTTLFGACLLLLPPGASSQLKTSLMVGVATRTLSTREQQALDFVASHSKVLKSRVSRHLGFGGKPIVDRLIRQKILRSESVWERPRVSAVYTNRIELNASKDLIEKLVSEYLTGRSSKRADLLSWFQLGNIAVTKSSLINRFGVAAVNWAFSENLLVIRKLRRDRDPLERFVFQQEFAHSPTQKQKKAIEEIVTQVRSNQLEARPANRRFLLHGVTGSGKTEVYLQAIEACISVGKQVIFLVPEIALTAQTLRRIGSRFPGKVGLLHSGLTIGQRYDQWWRIKNGDFPIVLGSRGAIFAPIEDPGLIVIDEEHEWTYKQSDQVPRYHARKVAEQISDRTGATLVLGSATPDIVSYRAAESGLYRLLELPDRLGGHPVTHSNDSTIDSRSRSLAKVDIVDMRQERAEGNFEMFSRALIEAIGKTLESDGKIILFLNRRGSASYVQCVDCGVVRKCRRCDIPFTYHLDKPSKSKTRGKLICHHCGYTVRVGSKCSKCGGKQMRRSAPGTQMVVNTVENSFPGVDVFRWDSDSARTASDHQRIMDEFVSSKASVLVGTQMVAKGLDIPRVTLVGVISADTGLALPDFSAGERAFQVLTQVVGRSGRGAWDGRAVIQTFNPEHYSIVAAADQDYRMFYDTEIRMRASQAYPPFTKMIRLNYSAISSDVAKTEAKRMSSKIVKLREAHGETGTEVIGPTPTYPLKVRNMHRWHILLKGSQPDRLLELANVGPNWTVDVDPM